MLIYIQHKSVKAFSSICPHCVPFLMVNSLETNAACCDSGPFKAAERALENSWAWGTFPDWCFLTYFVCPGWWYQLLAPAAAGRCVDGTSEWLTPEESCHPRQQTNTKNYLNLHTRAQRSAQIVLGYVSAESNKRTKQELRGLHQYSIGTESCTHSSEISSKQWTWKQHYRTEEGQSSQSRWRWQQSRCHKGASRWRSSLPWLFRGIRKIINHLITSITANTRTLTTGVEGWK